MLVKINEKLRRKIFKQIKEDEDLAIVYYSEGNMKEGRKYEKKADKLYRKHYKEMFKIIWALKINFQRDIIGKDF